MRFLLFYLCLYNFVFPIRLVAIPKFEWIILSIPLIWVLINFKKKLKYFSYTRFKTTFIFSIIMSIIGCISSLIYDGDYISVIVFMKFFLMITIANSLIIWGYYLYGNDFINKIIKILVISALIISTTNVIEFFNPEFRRFLFETIAVTGNSSYDTSFRTHGFASSGGASLSLGILVLALISYFKYSISEDNVSKGFYFFCFLFVYMSNIVIGRTGLFLGAPIVMYLLFFKNLSILNIFKKIFNVAILYFLIIYLINTIDEKLLDVMFKYGLEPIYKYLAYGTFESETTSGVVNMYYVPDVLHIFTGAGFWRWPTLGYSLPDPGYMKLIMSTGIFGVIIFYSYQLVIYREAYVFFTRKYKLKEIFFFLFIVLFLSELKEAVFTQNYAFKVLSLLLVYSWFLKSKFNGKKNNRLHYRSF
ncbi:hypothetical protein N9N09_01625 [Flavobacteriaceae bacterium]|nr:hypothetical protein [Flavobacteriaceae bacterium]